MEMTKDEIIKSFKNSGRAKKQIGIITQLSDTTQTKIKAILEEAKLLPKKVEPIEQAPVIKKEPKKLTKFTPELDGQILALCATIMSYSDIAEKLGLSQNSLKNRLQRLRENQKNQAEKPVQAEPTPLIPKSSEPFRILPIDMPSALMNMLMWVVDNFGTNSADCVASNKDGLACCNFNFKGTEYTLALEVKE